jgi:hypothetical protein
MRTARKARFTAYPGSIYRPQPAKDSLSQRIIQASRNEMVIRNFSVSKEQVEQLWRKAIAAQSAGMRDDIKLAGTWL